MLDLHSFARAANQAFDLSAGEASMPLTLVEVAPLHAGAGRAGQSGPGRRLILPDPA